MEEDFESYYSSAPASQFATEVTVNNIQVGFLAFAFGILLCVPTAFVLAMNGANLGWAAGLFAAVGQQPKFYGLILPHGLLELSAIVVAGAAGLAVGWAIVDPGDRPRTEALAEQGRRSAVIALGLALAFIVAGTIEGFVTPSGLHTSVRVAIGIAACLAFWTYVVVLGRRAASEGYTGAFGEHERHPAPASPRGPLSPLDAVCLVGQDELVDAVGAVTAGRGVVAPSTRHETTRVARSGPSRRVELQSSAPAAPSGCGTSLAALAALTLPYRPPRALSSR